MNNMRNKILSLLVLLLTVAAGAWAQDQYPIVYDFEAAADAGENPANKNGSAANGQAFYGWENDDKEDSKRTDYKGYEWAEGSVLPKVCHVWRRSDRINGNVDNNGGLKCPSNKEMAIDDLTPGLTVTIIYDATEATDKELLWAIGDGSSDAELGHVRATATINGAEAKTGETTFKSGDVITVNSVTPAENGSGYIVFQVKKGMVIKKIIIDVAPDIEVKPVAGTDNQWEFDMIASNVVLTPKYAAATIYDADENEKAAYETLKEAFANVRTGDVIKLDWNVTLTEVLQTRAAGNGAKFTLDFNGYVIDGDYEIRLNNGGDQLTFTDSSTGQLGGFKGGLDLAQGSEIVFEGGRYNIGNNHAKILNEFAALDAIPWSLAYGKEFVDLEGGADANNGFYVCVDWKTFELTIGAGRFATFYANENVSLTEGENIGFYTISSINDDRTKANVAPINSTIIPANIPTLVYNGDDDQQTVKLKATTDAVNLTVDHAPEFLGTATDREFTATDMAAADYYALSGGKIFVPVLDAGILAANQCWLQFDHGQQLQSGARSIKLVFEGETSGLSEELRVKSEEFATAQWYTIDGRKVATPNKKGVYIQNGKKVVK